MCARWTTEEDAVIIRHVNGLCRSWVRLACRELPGRTPRAIKHRAMAIGETWKSGVNHCFFDEWSREMAYSLGYIWADGTIEVRIDSYGNRLGRLRLRCSPKDDYIIHRIAKMIGGGRIQKPVPPMVIPFAANKEGVIRSNGLTSININSSRLVRTLIDKHGVYPNKSNINPRYPDIPDDMFSDFARGFLDGDGCITRSSSGAVIIFYGSNAFLAGLSSQIGRVAGVRPAKVCKNRRLGKIEWSGIEESARIFHFLYDRSGEWCLLRKRERWLAVASDKQKQFYKTLTAGAIT